MRVTQQMLHQNSVRHMNQNLSRFEKTNSQVSTGKMIERPSDNPNGVSKAMSMKSSIASNEQYARNTDEAKLWLDETDQTISSMTSVMHRVRELAVHASNGTINDSDRDVIASELEELSTQLSQFAQAKVNGQALFGGDKKFTISDGLSIKANASAAEVLGDTMAVLENLAAAVKAGNGIDLDAIDGGMERMLGAQADIGARTNRVEATENRLKDHTFELKTAVSKIEDVDYAEAIIRLKSEESIYQASLSASSKIIQQSLMDFLR
ncbi:flagellar hook-associated protein FlgL [Planococcus koreensis]|uniref:flagellar hook-associated protein FlgL n=1 Tax=Planococcus koreensis TaxID=112331 RepID=UPI0039FDBB52